MSLKWSRGRKVATFITSMAVITVVGAVIIVNVLSSPATGTITPPSGKKIVAPAASKTTGAYSGKYISFSYPATFDIIPSQKSAGILEVVSLYSNVHNDLIASISLSSNYIKDLSADYQAIAKNWQWK
jgi:uridine phosphorylase